MVSVCMATYNGERFVKEQIDSILPQLSENDELIISDDGSTDNTLAIIKSYNDSRIKIFYHEKNPAYEKIKHGRNFYYATSNFENALKQAQGDYIFLSDQDDIWVSGKIANCIKELQNNDLILHNIILFKNSPSDGFKLFNKSPIPQRWFLNLIKMNFWGCCMCFRKKLLQEILPIPRCIIGHDYWISTIALKKYKVSFLSEPLIYHRVHALSVSDNISNPLWFRILFRFCLFIEIIKK